MDKVVLVGSDVIYRQNIFKPLLKSLTQLLKYKPDAECLIVAWSGRAYFNDFCDLAELPKWDFKIYPKAKVVVDEAKGAQLDVQKYKNISFRDVHIGTQTVNIFHLVLHKD